MKDWRHSITLRLSLAFALLATLVFAALGLYFSRAADAHMAELDAHDLFGKLALIGHIGTQEATPEAFALRLNDALIGERGTLVAVDSDKTPLFRWPSDEQAKPLAAAGVELGRTPIRLNLAGASYRVVAADIETTWGETAHIVVARDIRHHTEFLDQLQHDFGYAVLAAALLTAIVAVLIVRHGLRPVRAIAHTAGRISAGQLGERIPEGKVPPELGELVHAFNAMLGRLEESFQRLSDFSADLAHELRTPIHSLRMQTEVSLGKARNTDEYRELLASNLEEYERLARIIADMLFLAKAGHGLVVPQHETIDLRALCQRLLDFYGILADQLDLQLTGEEVQAQGDRLMLERAIGNLLVNAIHHTPAGGRVTIAIERQNDEAGITISNTGPAIPPEALERIFERFVRLGETREGSGLGLAITRSIVLAHRGRISARSDERGTRFTVKLRLSTGSDGAKKF